MSSSQSENGLGCQHQSVMTHTVLSSKEAHLCLRVTLRDFTRLPDCPCHWIHPKSDLHHVINCSTLYITLAILRCDPSYITFAILRWVWGLKRSWRKRQLIQDTLWLYVLFIVIAALRQWNNKSLELFLDFYYCFRYNMCNVSQ